MATIGGFMQTIRKLKKTKDYNEEKQMELFINYCQEKAEDEEIPTRCKIGKILLNIWINHKINSIDLMYENLKIGYIYQFNLHLNYCRDWKSIYRPIDPHRYDGIYITDEKNGEKPHLETRWVPPPIRKDPKDLKIQE